MSGERLIFIALVLALSREFTKQPANVTVNEQQPVVFACQIQATPNAIVRWEKDEKPLPQSARYTFAIVL